MKIELINTVTKHKFYKSIVEQEKQTNSSNQVVNDSENDNGDSAKNDNNSTASVLPNKISIV